MTSIRTEASSARIIAQTSHTRALTAVRIASLASSLCTIRVARRASVGTRSRTSSLSAICVAGLAGIGTSIGTRLLTAIRETRPASSLSDTGIACAIACTTRAAVWTRPGWYRQIGNRASSA